MKKTILVLLCVLSAFAEESFEDASTRIAIKLYEDCSKDEGLSVCFKKKAITLLDRLGRMQNFSLTDGVTIKRISGAPSAPAITEQQLDQILPRSADAKEDVLSKMLFDKFFNLIGSRTVEIALPKFSADDFVEEARKGSIDIGGGGGGGKGGKGGKKGGKKGGMMNMMMMMIGTKMAALMALKTAATFIIAKKALIIGKIALILSGAMLLKKLMSSRNGQGGGHGSHSSHGGHGGGGGWETVGYSSGGSSGGGGDGGWHSSGGSSGGGWGKRSLDGQDLAYNAFVPKKVE